MDLFVPGQNFSRSIAFTTIIAFKISLSIIIVNHFVFFESAWPIKPFTTYPTNMCLFTNMNCFLVPFQRPGRRKKLMTFLAFVDFFCASSVNPFMLSQITVGVEWFAECLTNMWLGLAVCPLMYFEVSFITEIFSTRITLMTFFIVVDFHMLC